MLIYDQVLDLTISLEDSILDPAILIQKMNK